MEALKNVVKMIPGAYRVRSILFRMIGKPLRKNHGVPFTTPADRPAPPRIDTANLKLRYQKSGAAEREDTFVLYRVIGNDLVPRHAKGQSRENLAFILAHEPELPGCEKRFVVNRIVDPQEEQAVIGMLEQAGMPYLHIPFDWDEYREIPWDIEGVPSVYAPFSTGFRRLGDSEKSRILMRLYRHKNNYVMNNNGARNVALQEGKGIAKWVLPWDGNCFVTAEAWQDIVRDITSRPEMPYFLVPMARLTDNESLHQAGVRPAAEEEPQLSFRYDSKEVFDSTWFYGRRPKVELFWRLGVPGQWDSWRIEPWDLPCPAYTEEAGAVGKAGWVARLFSGQAHLEGEQNGLVDRGLARNEAIAGMVDHLDSQVLASSFDSARPCFIPNFLPGLHQRDDEYEPEGAGYKLVPPELMQPLKETAEGALQRGPYSVVDKKTLPPSQDIHDYWHPAPYFWPNPLPLPGLPYIRKDGQRVPGTRLYEPMSDNYDRTRLQRLFDDTFVLSLAGGVLGEQRFDRHAAKLIHRWFIDPDTAMAPHLQYAQVRLGWNKNQGSSSGLIEAKDFYYFLDAIKLLEARGALADDDTTSFRDWLSHYLHWLRTSPQGMKERASRNNHGTYYDLQVGTIAAFLGKEQLLRETLRDSHFRILQQFMSDGQQPEEMKRTTTAHYCCFNLQGWIHLAQLADSCGEDLWSFEGPEGQSIRKAMEWLLPYMGKEWPYQQIDEFDRQRFYPIYYAYVERYGMPPGLDNTEVPGKAAIKPLFFPHDGIRPFWQLRRAKRV